LEKEAAGDDGVINGMQENDSLPDDQHCQGFCLGKVTLFAFGSFHPFNLSQKIKHNKFIRPREPNEEFVGIVQLP